MGERMATWGARMRVLLDRWRADPATSVEVVGLASITGGLWMVYEPAALIVAGAGAILWAQGHRARSE